MPLKIFQPGIEGVRAVAWSPVIGVLRSVLAFASLLTLSATPTTSLFQPLWGIGAQPVCEGINALNLFCVFGPTNVDQSKWAAIGLLLLVMSGHFPQVTCFFHYWV